MIQSSSHQTVVVTGAGGFIGRAVVDAFLRRDWAVRALVGAPGQQVGELPDNVELFRAEITDATAVTALVDGADAVVHLAGQASVRASFDAPSDYSNVHVSGTATVLEACRRNKVKRLVYISSAEVYGRPQSTPVGEDHPLQARSPYAAAKIGAERFVESFVYAFQMEAIVLRPFSIYGPGLASQSLIGTILEQSRNGDRVELRDLKPVRDYCYVGDIADAIACSVAVPIDRLHYINLGSGQGTNVAQLARLILELIGRDMPVCEITTNRRPGKSEIYELICDPQLAHTVLGWCTTTTLKSGLENTIRSMENQ